MSKPRVLVVGSINLDAVTLVERFPKPGQTLLASDAFTGLGGKGANQAVAAANAGSRVSMFGAVGTDAIGLELLAKLEDFGVETGSVSRLEGLSGVAYITIDDSGENTIVVFSGANHRLSPEALALSLLNLAPSDRPNAVLMQGELRSEVIDLVSSVVSGWGVPFVLNLAPLISLDLLILKRVSVLILNQGEAVELAEHVGLTASSDSRQLLRLLSEAIGASVVITLGAAGAIYQSNGQVCSQASPPPLAVLDTTGAGDAFVGALTHALAGGYDLAHAVQLGVAAGSVAVEQLGTTASYPNQGQLANRLAQTEEPRC